MKPSPIKTQNTSTITTSEAAPLNGVENSSVPANGTVDSGQMVDLGEVTCKQLAEHLRDKPLGAVNVGFDMPPDEHEKLKDALKLSVQIDVTFKWLRPDQADVVPPNAFLDIEAIKAALGMHYVSVQTSYPGLRRPHTVTRF